MLLLLQTRTFNSNFVDLCFRFFSSNTLSDNFISFQKTDEASGELSNHLDPENPLEPALIWEADVEIQSGDVLLVRIDDTSLTQGYANDTYGPYIEK